MATVLGIVGFAYARPGGVTTHQEFLAHTDPIYDLVTSGTTPTPLPIPQPPPVPPPVEPPPLPIVGGGGTGPRIVAAGVVAQGSRGVDRIFATEAPTRREYPEVPHVKDEFAQRSLRLLWDQVYTLRQALREATARHDTLAAEVTATKDDVTAAHALAQSANALASTLTGSSGTFAAPPGGSSGLPGPVDPGIPDDGGQGAAGCSNHGATGHVPANSPVTSFIFGQIVCGCGSEFPALLVVTVDQPTRDANMVELLERMIWHLRLAGFTAGRQRNPSGAISKDKIAVSIEGRWLAYDVFPGVDFTVPLTTHCIVAGIGNMVEDAGIPD